MLVISYLLVRWGGRGGGASLFPFGNALVACLSFIFLNSI